MLASTTQALPLSSDTPRPTSRTLARIPPLPEAAAVALDTLLHSYSQVLFASSRPIGLLLLLATFTVPSVGLIGLVGVALASGLAWALQLDRHAVRSGVLGYNALLVFLGIGALLDRSPAFWVLAVAAALLVVLAHVALSAALARGLRLPVLSLPFVLVLWLIIAAVPHIRGMAVAAHPPALDLGALPGPAVLDTFLRSLGAIFFQPHYSAGLLVLAALVLYSRVATVHALLGFAVAYTADAWLLSFPADVFPTYAGFNIVLCAVALGGIYYVPSPASLLLAAAGSLVGALLSVGMLSLLAPFGLPVLSAPLNLAVLVTLYALGQRAHDSSPRTVAVPGGSPEQNLAWFRTRVARFQTDLPLRLALPFRGPWVCTQGNDGPHTHQGAWRHGLDFEVQDANGARYEGDGGAVSDWLCYGLPVLAPAPATVVRVVDGVADNLPGEVNLQQNWGNVVVLQLAPELYMLLAHLQPGSILVREGQTVLSGQELARCGASGRAPVPHLHVQLQRSPSVGDTTVPITFHDLVLGDDTAEPDEVPRVYLPREGEVVRNLDGGASLALRWPVGAVQRFELRDGDHSSVQRVTSELDWLGNRSLRSGDARLFFEDRGSCFYAYDVVGDSPLLLAIYAALLKVPLDDAPELVWQDEIDPRLLEHGWRSWLRDALSAFVPLSARRVRYRAERQGPLYVVTGEGEGLCTRAVLDAEGLRSIEVQIGDRSIHAVAQGVRA